MTIADTYTYSLYAPLEKKLDAKAMSETYREVFLSEVDAGTGFKRGGKSFVVMGETATIDCKATFACLLRASERVVMLDILTIARRLAGQYIPRWTDEDDAFLNNAECIIIHRLFDQAVLDTMTPTERNSVAWFVQEAIECGNVVVVSHDYDDGDLDALGEAFGKYVEQNFEAIHVTGTQENTKKKTTAAKRKHGGNASTRKRSR